MKRGDIDYFMSNDQIAVLRWKDNRVVHMLSNFQDPSEVVEVERKEKDGSKTKVNCPSIIKKYNSKMGFVDHFDHLKSLYEINRRSKKWWHRIFWFFIDCAIVNAFVIFKHLKQEKGRFLEFRLSLVAEEIMANKTMSKRRPLSHPSFSHKPQVPAVERYTIHLPVKTTKRRCGLCSTKSHQVRTNWMCKGCNVPLCLGKMRGADDCFISYHS